MLRVSDAQKAFGALGGELDRLSRELLAEFIKGLEKRLGRFRTQEALTRSCNT